MQWSPGLTDNILGKMMLKNRYIGLSDDFVIFLDKLICGYMVPEAKIKGGNALHTTVV